MQLGPQRAFVVVLIYNFALTFGIATVLSARTPSHVELGHGLGFVLTLGAALALFGVVNAPIVLFRGLWGVPGLLAAGLAGSVFALFSAAKIVRWANVTFDSSPAASVQSRYLGSPRRGRWEYSEFEPWRSGVRLSFRRDEMWVNAQPGDTVLIRTRQGALGLEYIDQIVVSEAAQPAGEKP